MCVCKRFEGGDGDKNSTVNAMKNEMKMFFILKRKKKRKRRRPWDRIRAKGKEISFCFYYEGGREEGKRKK